MTTTKNNSKKVYKDYSLNEYKNWAIVKIGNKGYAICQVITRISDDEVQIADNAILRYFSSWRVALDELNYEMSKRGYKAASAMGVVDIALELLGLTEIISAEQVKVAFRNKVKAASDGRGSYAGDMDNLVQAKEQAMKMIANA